MEKSGEWLIPFEKPWRRRTPPQKKKWAPKKPWVFFKRKCGIIFFGGELLFLPKTQTCEKYHPRRRSKYFRIEIHGFQDFTDSFFVAVTLTVGLGFLLDLDSIPFFSTACWAKVSIIILSSLEQKPSFQFGKCVVYCEYWWLEKNKRAAVGLENLLWPTRISCIFGAGVLPFNSITKIPHAFGPAQKDPRGEFRHFCFFIICCWICKWTDHPLFL